MDNQTWSRDREPPCPQPKLLHPCQTQPVLGTLGTAHGCRGVPGCSALVLKDPDNPRSSENCQLEPHQAVGTQE